MCWACWNAGAVAATDGVACCCCGSDEGLMMGCLGGDDGCDWPIILVGARIVCGVNVPTDEDLAKI